MVPTVITAVAAAAVLPRVLGLAVAVPAVAPIAVVPAGSAVSLAGVVPS
jgi:hypothetical protein